MLDINQVYFTLIWTEFFNKDLKLSLMDILFDRINESYSRYMESPFFNMDTSELECINLFLSEEVEFNLNSLVISSFTED